MSHFVLPPSLTFVFVCDFEDKQECLLSTADDDSRRQQRETVPKCNTPPPSTGRGFSSRHIASTILFAQRLYWAVRSEPRLGCRLRYTWRWPIKAGSARLGNGTALRRRARKVETGRRFEWSFCFSSKKKWVFGQRGDCKGEFSLLNVFFIHYKSKELCSYFSIIGHQRHIQKQTVII